MRDVNDKRTIEEMQASVWASFDRMQKQREADMAAYEKKRAKDNAAFEKRQAAAEKSMKELKKSQKETNEQIKKTDEQIKKTEEQIKKTSILLGNFGNNLGTIAEEYFFNSFKKGKVNFFGEKFDEVRKNVRKTNEEKLIVEDEYDIVLINGKSIGIIEVKHKAHENHIPSIIKKATSFRVNFPKFKNHIIYLGLATMSFYKELEDICEEHGIAIIKQVGDTIIINDGKLKKY